MHLKKTVCVRCKKNQWPTPEIECLITLRKKYYNRVIKSVHSLPDTKKRTIQKVQDLRN